MPPRLPLSQREIVSRAHALLAELRQHVSRNDLHSELEKSVSALADELAQFARVRQETQAIRSPLQCVASWIREHVGANEMAAGKALRLVLREQTRESLRRNQSSVTPSQRGVGEAEFAALLGVTHAELGEMLRTSDGRRALGFPMYCGPNAGFRWQRVWIDDPAIERSRREGIEPHHPVPLPEDYR